MVGGCIFGLPFGCECEGGILRGAMDGSDVFDVVFE